jgi:hypothetical protein
MHFVPEPVMTGSEGHAMVGKSGGEHMPDHVRLLPRSASATVRPVFQLRGELGIDDAASDG